MTDSSDLLLVVFLILVVGSLITYYIGWTPIIAIFVSIVLACLFVYLSILFGLTSSLGHSSWYHVEAYTGVLLIPIIIIAILITLMIYPQEFNATTLDNIHSSLIVISGILIAGASFTGLNTAVKKHIILIAGTIIILSLMSLVMNGLGYNLPSFYLLIICVETLLVVVIFRVLYLKVGGQKMEI